MLQIFQKKCVRYQGIGETALHCSSQYMVLLLLSYKLRTTVTKKLKRKLKKITKNKCVPLSTLEFEYRTLE